MILKSPQEALRFFKEKQATGDLQVISECFSQQDEFAVNGVGKSISEASIAELIEVVAEEAEVELSAVEARSILDLFPYARAAVAENGVGDTDACGQALDAVASYILRCTWPINGDDVDSAEWRTLLKTEAKRRGLKVIDKRVERP